jgi:hydrogenase maturation protease
MNRSRILVAGFGNSLVGDDGAGPAVVARLLQLGLPPGVRAEDCGSDALHLPSLWREEPEIWLVDAVRGGAAAGTILRLDHEQVLALPQRHATAHSLSLAESLRWVALTYPAMAAVRYRFWGIEVERLVLAEGLSAPVTISVDAVVAEILGVARAAPDDSHASSEDRSR